MCHTAWCTEPWLPPPPLQAAFLDLKLTSSLARLVHRLAGRAAEEADSERLLAMALDALTYLAAPNVALNPVGACTAAVLLGHSYCEAAVLT